MPAGWRQDVAATNRIRDQLAAKPTKGMKFEIHTWAPEDPGPSLVVYWFLVPFSGNAGGAIDELDRGVVKSLPRSTTMQGRPDQIVGSMVIRETRGDPVGDNEANLRMVRRYQPAVDGLHALMAMCVVARSDDSVCDAPLSSIQFTVSDPIALDESGRPLAYQLGRLLGTLIVVGVPLGILLAIRNRRSRRVVTAGGRPGSPAGPGGAADGR